MAMLFNPNKSPLQAEGRWSPASKSLKEVIILAMTSKTMLKGLERESSVGKGVAIAAWVCVLVGDLYNPSLAYR